MGARRVPEAADNHPVVAAFVVWLVLLVSLILWDELQKAPVLLGVAARDHRTDLYGEIASSAVGVQALNPAYSPET